MDIDNLKLLAQGNQLDNMLMMLNMDREKVLADDVSGPHHPSANFSYYYPDNPFSSLASSDNNKSPIISFAAASDDSSNINTEYPEPEPEDSSSLARNNNMAAMREVIFRIAAMQPINIDPEAVKPPKRRNVRISSDPQSVAARHRRERISERIRILQRLVPGGTKMDTASMLDEAIHYVKFLKRQVQSLERAGHGNNSDHGIGNVALRLGFPGSTSDYSDNNNNNDPTSLSYHYYHNHQGYGAPGYTGQQGYGGL